MRDAKCVQAADNFMFTQSALKMDWSIYAAALRSAPFANMIAVFGASIKIRKCLFFFQSQQ